MHKFGSILIWIASVLIVLGVGGGFLGLLSDVDWIAKILFTVVPIAFLMLFLGFVVTLFHPE